MLGIAGTQTQRHVAGSEVYLSTQRACRLDSCHQVVPSIWMLPLQPSSARRRARFSDFSAYLSLPRPGGWRGSSSRCPTGSGGPVTRRYRRGQGLGSLEDGPGTNGANVLAQLKGAEAGRPAGIGSL